MKKICLFVIAFVMIFALAACGVTEPAAGEELILAARKAYAALDSARVDVVNDETGEAEQTFIFKYDEKGMMTYSYIGASDGIALAQYNNGYEQFTNDNGEISKLESSDLHFTAYSREVPYPMADEGLIVFFKKALMQDGCIVTEKDGVTQVLHSYVPEKIGIYDGEGELKGFSVSYRFDEKGNLIDFTESADIEIDGALQSHKYTIYITEKNAVGRVENVVDFSEKE